MRTYSEKEIAIFRGVWSLAENGADLTKITSRQIAAAAGMGKATIYDYFSSKEEIVTQAVIHSLNIQNEIFTRRLQQLDTFEKKMRAVYANVVDTVENSCSIFSIITAMGGPDKVSDYFHTAPGGSDLCRLLSDIYNNFEQIMTFGQQTGAISSKLDKDYVTMVLFASLFTTGKTRNEKQLPRRQIIDNAYTMLHKALN